MKIFLLPKFLFFLNVKNALVAFYWQAQNLDYIMIYKENRGTSKLNMMIQCSFCGINVKSIFSNLIWPWNPFALEKFYETPN
jgi:hypothetical protein